MDLEWKYGARTCSVAMDNYIRDVCIKYAHHILKKPQLSPYKHCAFFCGAKTQYAAERTTAHPSMTKASSTSKASLVPSSIMRGSSITNFLSASAQSDYSRQKPRKQNPQQFTSSLTMLQRIPTTASRTKRATWSYALTQIPLI